VSLNGAETRLSQVQVPFLLRLINGMQPNAREITVTVTKVRKNFRSRQFELVLGKIVELKQLRILNKLDSSSLALSANFCARKSAAAAKRTRAQLPN